MRSLRCCPSSASLLSYNATLSVSPSGLRSLSTATPENTALAWPATSPSTPLQRMYGLPLQSSPQATAASGVQAEARSVDTAALLPSRLSRRQIRQREQRWGTLWRYRPEVCPPSPCLAWPPSPPFSAGSTSHSRSTHAEGIKLARPPPQRRSESAVVLEHVARDTPETINHPLRAAATTATTVTPPLPERSSRIHATSPSAGDPLLAFLEQHEDDAADLLAMWTSLHRSCVYASELSESVVLQVRFFFHSLLRYRAVAAALEFYYRLMGLGVQLQQSDLLLLLSSLPYEHANAAEQEQLRKAHDDVALEQDRLLWAKRRQAFKDAAARTSAASRTAQPEKHVKETDGRVMPVGSEMATAMNACERQNGVEAEATPSPHSSPSGAAAAEREGQDAHLPSAIASRVAFHQQPEWIKRWILYEASMGTLDGLDALDDAGRTHTTALAAQDTTAASVETATVSAATENGAAWLQHQLLHDATAQSEMAKRVMELCAVVEHLHLLALGSMQRDSQQPTQRPATRQRKALTITTGRSPRSSGATAQHYWKEALQATRQTYAASLWQSPVTKTTHDELLSDTPITTADEPLQLPTDVAVSLQSMMREVQSWEGALALLRLHVNSAGANQQRRIASRPITLTDGDYREGAILFVALAAQSQPWKAQAKVEEWMHQSLLPRLSEDTSAAAGAVQALWLSHLCSIKAARPEVYIALEEEAATYMPVPRGSNTDNSVFLHKDLFAMVDDMRRKTEAAVAVFQQEVRRTLANRRAAQVLVASAHTSVAREGAEAQSTGQQMLAPHLTQDTSLATTSGSMGGGLPAFCSSSALMPAALVDAFQLCCASVKEAVWLLLSTSAQQDEATATAAALQFLECSLYGPAGLHTTFQQLYGVAGRDGSPFASESVERHARMASEAAAAAAPERAFVSCVMSITLLQLVQVLCTSKTGSPHRRNRFGSHVRDRAALRLLVELAWRAVAGVQSLQLKEVPWRWAAELRTNALVDTTAHTIRALVKELDVHAKDEKAVFGALAEQDVDLLANLARLIVKTSDLSATTQGRRQDASLCPVWTTLAGVTSPRVLQGVQLAFRRSSALGRRVRHRLTSHEAERLESLLARTPHVRRAGATRGTEKVSRRAPRNAETEGALPVRQRARVSDTDFAIATAVRASVYDVVQHESTSEGVKARIQQLASASTSWKTSLLLCQLITKDVGLARGTCAVDFFATTLHRMTEDIARRAAAAAAAQQNGRSSRGNRRRGSMSHLTHARTAPLPAVGPSSLWLNAIDVFWSAVDHVTHSPASTAAAAPSSALSTIGVPTAQEQERAVLAQLLLPLVAFSRAIHRLDLGRQWRRTWAHQHSAAERRSPSFQLRNIAVLSALGDASALDRCVASFSQLGNDTALLCEVAAQHSNWSAALDALMKVFGTLEEQQAAQTCYPLTVAQTILTLLGRSPTNLSNTAMRVEALQLQRGSNDDAWDGECSAQVVRLLLRNRRWSLALQHVDTALAQPAMQRVSETVAHATAGTLPLRSFEHGRPEVPQPSGCSSRELISYVTLLTLALQATAIGGDNATAPRYYDALKLTLRSVFSPIQGTSGTSHSGAASSTAVVEFGAPVEGAEVDHDVLGLDAVLDMASGSSSSSATPNGDDNSATRLGTEEASLRAELRELEARARLLFFRSMTKKMMSMSGTALPAEQEGEEDTSDTRNAFWESSGDASSENPPL